MVSFQLMRLPMVAQSEVLKCLTSVELYFLSDCSEKTSRMIQTVPKNRLLMSFVLLNDVQRISFNDGCTFMLWHTNRDHGYEEFSVHSREGTPSGGECVLLNFNTVFNDYDVAYIDNMNALEIITGRLMTLLNFTVRHIHVEQSRNSQIFRRIMTSILRDPNGIIEELYLDNAHMQLRLEDALWLVEKTTVTSDFHFQVDTNEQFTLNLVPICEKVYVYPASCLDVNTIINFKSVACLELRQSNLTVQNMSTYINAWKAGDLPKLERFSLYNFRMNEADTIVGFTPRQLSERKEPARIKRYRAERPATNDGGVDIIANDGTQGSLQYKPDYRQLWFFVWKEE